MVLKIFNYLRLLTVSVNVLSENHRLKQLISVKWIYLLIRPMEKIDDVLALQMHSAVFN